MTPERRIMLVGPLALCFAAALPEVARDAAAKTDEPARAKLTADGDVLRCGKGTSPLGLETFVFDKQKKMLVPPKGITMTQSNCPLPIVITSMSSNATGAATMDYANAVLDVRGLKGTKWEKELRVAEAVTPDGEEIASVKIRLAGRDEVFVSREYVVFPGVDRTIADGGPFLTLRFEGVAPESSGGAGSLIVTRNGQQIGRAAARDGLRVELNNVKTSNDVVKWQVEGGEGTEALNGEIAFVLRSSAPDLVEYVVSVIRPGGAQTK
jgi:hypothetical protein